MKLENINSESKTVTIFKINCYESYQVDECGISYSLYPWGINTDHYKGTDDGGIKYHLPDGYHVAECEAGSKEIYTQSGDHCQIIAHSSGEPQLVSKSNSIMPVLKQVRRILG